MMIIATHFHSLLRSKRRFVGEILCLLFWLPLTTLAVEGCPVQKNWLNLSANPSSNPDEVTVASGTARFDTQQKRGELIGEVTVWQGNRVAMAERLDYDQDTLRLFDRIRYHDPFWNITATQGDFSFTTSSGFLENSHYLYTSSGARGDAAKITLHNDQQATLEETTYSTCPEQNNPAWQLKAGELHLDKQTQEGYAKHVWFQVGGWPMLYLPVMRFPLTEDRKTGFLVPTLGYSERTGTDIRIPYYWNIDPQHDLTTSLRSLSRRGVELDNEFRYLYAQGKGNLYWNYLPYDRLQDSDRYSLGWRHQGKISDHLYTSLDFAEVSDSNYFRDLDNPLSFVLPNYLERQLSLRYQGDYLDLFAQVQDYQVVDANILGDQHPYRRLPHLAFSFDWPLKQEAGSVNTQGEVVRFQRDRGPTGWRTDWNQSFLWKWDTLNWSFMPKFSYRVTQYRLDDDQTITRSLPALSLDSSTRWEREITWGNNLWIQTLTPRLFYLYVPYRQQNDIPLFDTKPLDFNLIGLFQENRFTGIDRLGDENRLTVGVTSEFIAPETGRALISTSLGQIFYFQNRRVALLDSDLNENWAGSSDLVAEAHTDDWKHWSSHLAFQWDPSDQRPGLGTLGLRYEKNPHQIINMGYRYRENLLNQTDLSFIWPLAKEWHGIARWNHALVEQKDPDIFLGLGYDSCCFGITLLGRRHIVESGEYDNALLALIEFKGLTKLGDRLGDFLKESLLTDPLEGRFESP